MTKLEFTDDWEIDYIQHLVLEDIKQMEKKLQRRKNVATRIYFDKEKGDF